VLADAEAADIPQIYHRGRLPSALRRPAPFGRRPDNDIDAAGKANRFRRDILDLTPQCRPLGKRTLHKAKYVGALILGWRLHHELAAFARCQNTTVVMTGGQPSRVAGHCAALAALTAASGGWKSGKRRYTLPGLALRPPWLE
jgi:hypothetical protein